jgi:hypothetical protein
MLFFRSEERVNEWCSSRGVPANPIVSLQQLWQLSVAWYSNRLTPDAKRPGADEIRAIFARVGLTGPFWELP